MPTFTDGEWKVLEEDKGFVGRELPNGSFEYIAYCGILEDDLDIGDEDRYEEVKGNSKLIAQAKNMLGIIEEFIVLYDLHIAPFIPRQDSTLPERARFLLEDIIGE